MKTASLAFSLALSLVACGHAPSGQTASLRSTSEVSADEVLSRIIGKDLAEISASKHYREQKRGNIKQNAPFADLAHIKHFTVTTYVSKADGVSFTTYASYDDDEDGGNSYGWVTTGSGTLLAKIADSFVEPLPQDAGNQLSKTPRPLSPTVDLKNAKAREALMTKVVAEFEQASGDASALEVNTTDDDCVISPEGDAAVCTVDYLQDRWNGRMRLFLGLKDGQAVDVKAALFDGSF